MEPNNLPPLPSSGKPSPPQNNLLRYSGLGFQMLLTIGVAIWLGRKLDDWLDIGRFPAFTTSLLLVAVIGSLMGLVRNLNKPD